MRQGCRALEVEGNNIHVAKERRSLTYFRFGDEGLLYIHNTVISIKALRKGQHGDPSVRAEDLAEEQVVFIAPGDTQGTPDCDWLGVIGMFWFG